MVYKNDTPTKHNTWGLQENKICRRGGRDVAKVNAGEEATIRSRGGENYDGSKWGDDGLRYWRRTIW